MKRLSDPRSYPTPAAIGVRNLADATAAAVVSAQAEINVLNAGSSVQPFTTSGVIVSTTPAIFVEIDNTGGDVVADIAPVAGTTLCVKVIAFDILNVCRLRALSGSIEGAGFVDYLAVNDSATYLCDGTDWWLVD